MVNAAVRERAANLSRDEQLEILSAELQDKELDVPPRPIIDVMLDLMFYSDAEEPGHPRASKNPRTVQSSAAPTVESAVKRFPT